MKYEIHQLIPYVGKEELDNLKKVIESKWLTEGLYSNKFLDLIKEFTGAKYALLTNNGTLALYLSMKAMGIQKGDEVIVPDFTFNASASSVHFAGGKPIFVDVCENTFNIDVTKIEKLITNKTRAIMPVHIYGQAADMDPIIELAKKYNLKVIEDAAQGYGVFYKGNHAGTIGDVGIISFFADKTITMGEGAVILTNNSALFEKLKYIRNQGRTDSGTFVHTELGMNFRVTDLQAAVGVAQLEKFNKIKTIKLENYLYYRNLLSGVKEIVFMREVSYSNFIPFRVAIKTKSKNKLIEHLENRGIQTRGFFYPLHKQPCYSHLNYNSNSFPVTNKLFEEGICLPVHCYLEKKQIRYICDTIGSFEFNY